MATVNQYKFYGKTTTAAESVDMLEPTVNETIIVRSLRVTNKSGSNTPTVTIKNNNFEIVNTQQLATATSVEILSLPLIVEGGTKLSYTTTGTVSDFSNAPYENVIYENVNSVGRQWVRRYGLALAKEMLGYIRGKYSSLPIPNADITLNGGDLISAAGTEKEGLISELKEILDTMSRQAQLERKQAEADAMQSTFNKIPLKIYIG